MKIVSILGIVMLTLVLVQGCAPGYNSVLFATKSNLGFDADTAPPNLEVGISRHEGVLEPTFEGGQTAPVMASFSSESSAFYNFFWGVKSTFATGEAAFTMSYLYDDPTPSKGAPIPYERVTLKQEPEPQYGGRFIRAGEVRPVLFGTDTVLGIKVRWSGQTAQYPSSINIGFKRKEAALAPIGLGPNRITDPDNPNNNQNKPLEADLASLLATIDTDVTIPGTSARLTYLQYFATGSAANNLARRDRVREAMLRRAGFQVRKAEEGKAQRETNRKLIDEIIVKFNGLKEEPTKQNKILQEAQALGLVEQSVTLKDFEGSLALREGGELSVTEKLKKLVQFAETV